MSNINPIPQGLLVRTFPCAKDGVLEALLTKRPDINLKDPLIFAEVNHKITIKFVI